MAFNEDSRVKVPALLHLTRLGYQYISRKHHQKRTEETNIFPEIFKKAIQKINPSVADTDIERHLQEISLNWIMKIWAANSLKP